MSSRTDPADEMSHAQTLPQLDASSLVDAERLEEAVTDMYRHVAREEEAELSRSDGAWPSVGRAIVDLARSHRAANR